jgi:predicted RNase H-like HicB family nuclease
VNPMAAHGRVRVELIWDASVRRWDYEVPDLNILGSGGSTKEEALRRAADAIAFALQSDADEAEPGVEVTYLPIAVGI